MSRTTTALLLVAVAVVALLAIGAAAAAAENADAASYVSVAACAPDEARAQREMSFSQHCNPAITESFDCPLVFASNTSRNVGLAMSNLFVLFKKRKKCCQCLFILSISVASSVGRPADARWHWSRLCAIARPSGRRHCHCCRRVTPTHGRVAVDRGLLPTPSFRVSRHSAYERGSRARRSSDAQIKSISRPKPKNGES